MKRITFIGLCASAFLIAPPAMADECDAYAKHLKTCEPFVCKFKHPLTGKMMQKQIVGTVGGKCKTTEEMPNNGKFECNLTAKTRTAVAQELATLKAAQKTDVSGEADAEGKVKTKLKADGKPVDDALQDALNSGECTISGYPDS